MCNFLGAKKGHDIHTLTHTSYSIVILDEIEIDLGNKGEYYKCCNAQLKKFVLSF